MIWPQPHQLMFEWKNLRRRVSKLPVDQAISEVNHFWSYAPFVSRYLDPHTANDWPGPWELVEDNYFCDLAKALGMFYTLYLSDHGKSLDMELKVLSDPDGNLRYILSIEQGKYVANIVHDEVVNNTQVDEQLTVKYRYTVDDLPLTKY
jgi:hypothetical protein